jgi:photosystem II stability/assembly factor-like uncharacterized protein
MPRAAAPRSAAAATGVRAASAACAVSILAVALAAIGPLPPTPPAAAPADGAWQPIGPPGSFRGIFSCPAGPATLYLAVQNGAVWTSQDGGRGWQLAGSTGHAAAVDAPPVVVDPSRCGIAYANTISGSAYKTTDGGVTWTLLLSALHVLAVAPSAPQTLYGTNPASFPAALARSDDGGASWRLTGSLPSGFSILDFAAVDPAAPDIVYVAGNAGVVKSLDAGAHWSQPFSPAASQVDRPLGLLLDPGHPATLYLAYLRLISEGGAGAALYRSDDAGATWMAASAGLPGDLAPAGFVLTPSGSLYAALLGRGDGSPCLYRSADRGASWQPVSAAACGYGLAVDFETPDHLLLLGGTNGVQLSDDGGHSWSATGQQLGSAYVAQVAADPAGAGSMVLLTSGGPFSPSPLSLLHTADGGSTWSTLPPPPQALFRLVLDAQPGVVYAGRSGIAQAFLVSRDGGASWALLGGPHRQGSPYPTAPLDLAADPTLPGKLVELVCDEIVIAIDQFTCRDYALYRSNTGGRGWRLLGRRLDSSGASSGLARLDPSDRATAYAAFGNGLFRSDAATLDLVQLPLAGPIVDLAVDPASPATLYAATGRPRPLWKSLDRGATWAPASAGLPRGAAILNLAIDPATPSTLYLGTDRGVFVTDDGARSWQLLGTGLPGRLVTSVAAAAAPPRTVWSGTAGGGVFAFARP